MKRKRPNCARSFLRAFLPCAPDASLRQTLMRKLTASHDTRTLAKVQILRSRQGVRGPYCCRVRWTCCLGLPRQNPIDSVCDLLCISSAALMLPNGALLFHSYPLFPVNDAATIACLTAVPCYLFCLFTVSVETPLRASLLVFLAGYIIYTFTKLEEPHIRRCVLCIAKVLPLWAPELQAFSSAAL